MAKLVLQSANAVSQTLLIALHARVLEARRSAPLVRDSRAADLAAQLDYDPTRMVLSREDQFMTILRLRQFDRRVADFLARTARPTVVHIGCGLDTRFDRVDNGLVRWFDLDLPEVISLRRQLIPQTRRSRMIPCSALDPDWMDRISAKGEFCLFAAEGVFPYFEAEQVRWLVQTLERRFPGCELVFDALSPPMMRVHQIQLRLCRLGPLLRWGLRSPQEVEAWADGVHLMQAWYYFDQPEPRLGAAQLMRYVPGLARGAGVFHFKLGDPGAPS
ncbi:MAG: class I SAM-dependent methyltransferase [Chloroflexi bacterium]|nr:class I SAM-dependent methyltransferase [Chloroflexota bacterium]